MNECNYQPKGGMCSSCAHKHKDCSRLPFQDMQVLSRSCDVVIVKCSEFKREVVNEHIPVQTSK